MRRQRIRVLQTAHLGQLKLKLRAASTGREILHRRPPAITRVSPVIQEESLEAKKTAAGAMSSTSPIRPRGVSDESSLRKSPSLKPAEITPSLSTMPGLI